MTLGPAPFFLAIKFPSLFTLHSSTYGAMAFWMIFLISLSFPDGPKAFASLSRSFILVHLFFD